MASNPGALSEWPWESLGNFKYVLFVPFAVKAIHANLFGGHDVDNWCFHMLLSSALRLLHGQIWISVSRWYYLIEKYQIQTKGIKFEQVDREEHWDNFIILHVLVATAVHLWMPGFRNFPLYDGWGMVILLLMHMGPAESVYYWLHRLLHHPYLYSRYHSHHHASFVTEPISGSVHPFLEHLMYTSIFAIPLLGTWLLNGASISMFYVYWISFDLLNNIGHCNFEFIPTWLYHSFPPLKYLIYTPSFHSLHHSQVITNYALFMPLYDYLGGTVDPNSDILYETVRRGRNDRPDFVFLGHGTELLSVFHVSFGLKSFASRPYKVNWPMYILWPLTLPITALIWLFGKAFTAEKHRLKGLRIQTWIVPRFGFQYFLSFEKNRINHLIKNAILDADKMGVKVFTLGALNKNESLNGGGKLYMDILNDVSVRVVHGNTLTAAVVLHELPKKLPCIFLTGATSKLGRAIALYLCQKGTKVLMLTKSRERFESIQAEAPEQFRSNLKQVETYKEGSDCKVWVVGKWLSNDDQMKAPSGTFFHQFVVPPIQEIRRDCEYGKLAAMKLPKDIQGLRTCEMTMERGCVHACHAGGLVHALEGWTHHEVGAIDHTKIDLTWEAALRHGFQPVSSHKRE